ncbi:MAG: NusG domain II-containing protein [Oscillospiraceae bacterium]|nr:NusG domain II-containing protein [Oscillospiraceae bacterium]
MNDKHTNKTVFFGVGILVIIAAALIAVWFLMKSSPKENPAAEIRQNGVLIKTVPLSEDAEFTVTCESGFNTVAVKNGAISVTSADCPDKVCVKTGEISGGGIPIICLPHRLEITVINGESTVDAQT